MSFHYSEGKLASAASAALLRASLGSELASPPPRVRGGPPTVLLPAAALGTGADFAGAGAEPRGRPGSAKGSGSCLPQMLPMLSDLDLDKDCI